MSEKIYHPKISSCFKDFFLPFKNLNYKSINGLSYLISYLYLNCFHNLLFWYIYSVLLSLMFLKEHRNKFKTKIFEINFVIFYLNLLAFRFFLGCIWFNKETFVKICSFKSFTFVVHIRSNNNLFNLVFNRYFLRKYFVIFDSRYNFNNFRNIFSITIS